jgi:hypothetical protein
MIMRQSMMTIGMMLNDGSGRSGEKDLDVLFCDSQDVME